MVHAVMADIFTNISAVVSPALKGKFDFLTTENTHGFDEVIREVCTLTGVSYIDSVPEKIFGPWQAVKNTHDVLYGIIMCRNILRNRQAREDYIPFHEKRARGKAQDRSEELRKREDDMPIRHTERIAVVDLSHSNLYPEKDHIHLQTSVGQTKPNSLQEDNEMNMIGSQLNPAASQIQGKCRKWPYISKADQTNFKTHQIQSSSHKISKCKKCGTGFESQGEMEVHYKNCNLRTMHREGLRHLKRNYASSSSDVDHSHVLEKDQTSNINNKRGGDITVVATSNVPMETVVDTSNVPMEDASYDTDNNAQFAKSVGYADESLSNNYNQEQNVDGVEQDSHAMYIVIKKESDETDIQDVQIKSEPTNDTDKQGHQDYIYQEDNDMNITEVDTATKSSNIPNDLDQDGKNEHQPYIVRTFPAETKYCCASCSYAATNVKQINDHVQRVHHRSILCEESNETQEPNEFNQTSNETVMHDVQIKKEPHDDCEDKKIDNTTNITTEVDTSTISSAFSTNIPNDLDQDGNEHQPYFIRTYAAEIKYCCASCSYSANSVKQISDHVKRVHYRSFLCEVCPARFGLKKDLTRHYRKTHKLSIEIKPRGRGKSQRLPTLLGLLSK